MGAGVQDNGARRRRFDPVNLPALSDAAVSWQRVNTCAVATPTSALIGFVTDALFAESLEPVGEVLLVRHRPGDSGLPPADGRGNFRFALDLAGPSSSLWGGTLLFMDETGRGSGWRAEAGALTVWSGTDPELTELVPGAVERLTLIGVARSFTEQP